jgi:hypothetical protein
MRLALPSASIAVLATVAALGCGSGDSGPAQTNARSQGSTGQQTAAEEPGGGPAGAAAHSCTSGAAYVGGLRVTGVDCGAGQAVAAAWSGNASCASPAGSSRFACSVRGYRCLGAATERGVAVSCARRGRSIAFVAKRR